jgi:hypothetical protein
LTKGGAPIPGALDILFVEYSQFGQERNSGQVDSKLTRTNDEGRQFLL